MNTIKVFKGNAINIPVSDILHTKSNDFFRQLEKDSIIVVFYSKNQHEINGPWMLLKQLGLSNTKGLPGGYNSLLLKKSIIIISLKSPPTLLKSLFCVLLPLLMRLGLPFRLKQIMSK